MENQALRFNNGKPQYSLIDFKALEPLVRVLEAGAVKYSRDNWKLGLNKHDTIDSLLRHAGDLSDGKLYDPDTGVHSIGGIMVNAMFYSAQYIESDGGVLVPNLDWEKKLKEIAKNYDSLKKK